MGMFVFRMLRPTNGQRPIEGEGAIVTEIPSKSALTLLETRILLVDHQSLALADNDLAITGTALDARANLHGGTPVCDSLAVLARTTRKFS